MDITLQCQVVYHAVNSLLPASVALYSGNPYSVVSIQLSWLVHGILMRFILHSTVKLLGEKLMSTIEVGLSNE